jgi:hypothetical protein
MNSQQTEELEQRRMGSPEEFELTVNTIKELHKNIEKSNTLSVSAMEEHNKYWNIMKYVFELVAKRGYSENNYNFEFLLTIQKHMIEFANKNNITYTLSGGRRRNNSKHADMKMKDVKILCKNNNIKLSTTVNNKRVVYTKKELITKLKRKKAL